MIQFDPEYLGSSWYAPFSPWQDSNRFHLRPEMEVTHRTIFEAGSTTKLVTASLLMMLVEEGPLGLDRPVNQFLDRWEIPRADRSDVRGDRSTDANQSTRS